MMWGFQVRMQKYWAFEHLHSGGLGPTVNRIRSPAHSAVYSYAKGSLWVKLGNKWILEIPILPVGPREQVL